MKTLNKLFNMLNCSHKYIPDHQLSTIDNPNDGVYVSICKCGRHQYKSFKQVRKAGN